MSQTYKGIEETPTKNNIYSNYNHYSFSNGKNYEVTMEQKGYE